MGTSIRCSRGFLARPTLAGPFFGEVPDDVDPADYVRLLRAARAGESLASFVERTGGTWSPEETAVANGLGDDARLDAITATAGAIDCYFTYEGETPDSLDAMRAALDARASTTSCRPP